MKKGENEQQQNEQNEDEDELDLDENQIIETILALGNEIWKNFGQEEEIEDVQIFFQHQFYIHCFQMAYPDFDFSKLLEGDDEDDPEKMAECIQALIDLLAEEILLQDMNHIKGEEIVQGNPEHCINLLQILQQISQAGANQDGEDSNDIQLNQNESASDDQENYQRKNKPKDNDKNQQQSNQKQKQNKENNSQERFENLNFKNKDKNLFSGEDLDNIGALNINKQQFLDNLDDDIDLVDGMHDNNTSSKKQYNKRQQQRFQRDGVGNVGDAIGQELDIEFDDDIQQKLNGDEQNKQQIMDGEDDEEEEEDLDIDQNGQIIDHNDVNIIDNGQDFQEDDQYNDEDDDEDGQLRNLNRQTKNIANLNDEDEEQIIQNQNEDEGNEDMYGDEIVNEQNSSNFQMNNQNNMIDSDDDEGLSQLHDQLKNIDNQNQLQQNKGGKNQNQFQGISQQIIDDQNLEIMYNYKDQLNDEEDEGQHYPDDGDDDDELEEGQEDNENFQQLENHLQISKNQKQQVEEEYEEMNLNYDELGDIDPELLEAAQKFGLDKDGIRLLQQQIYQKAAEEDDDNEEEEEYDDQQAENNEEENDLEGQEFAEMLNGFKDRNQSNLQQMQIQDDDDDEEEEEELQDDEENDIEKQQILRGGQNIEEDQSQYGNEEDDESQNLQKEMENKLKQLNDQENDQQNDRNDDEDLDDQNDDSEYNQDEDDEDDDQQIDIQNLNDNEKAILIQYLQDEYQKNPDSLPMSKEVIEQFLAENQDLLQKLAQEDEYEKDFVSSEIIVEGENENDAMIIQGENEEQEDQNEQNDNGIANSDEINIEGGEHNIIEDENEEEYNQENYTDNQNQQDDYDNEEDQNQENEEDDEENIDPNQHQLYNAQYQNDDDNNQMMINLQNQQQQFNQQQKIQQLLYFQNQQQQKMHKLKKNTIKKKSTIPFANRKSSQLNSQSNQQMFKKTSKPLTIAANKKFKRSKITVNTISHDDFQNRKSHRYNNVRMPQKSHSSKRPQTAKQKKNFNNHIVGEKIAKNLNNYMQTGISANTIQKQKKQHNIVQLTNSANQMIIPQQSQMFTSFGMMPHQVGGHSLSQRKTSNNLKLKKYGIYGSIKPESSVSLKQKKLKNNVFQKGQKNLQSINVNNNQSQQEQFLQQQQNIQEINLNQQAQYSQNLVEMPILSEEFLNQLNEEQLQALLEQQQQLMMLQQQSQQQNIYNHQPQSQQVDSNQQQVINLQPYQQDNINILSQDNQQLQQLLMLQQQQYQQQQQQQKQLQQQSVSGRSRSKPKIPATVSSAARIPSGGLKHGVFGSGSRSKNGSKKRNQKTRSSLNVGNALNPLNQALNLAMPQSQQVLQSQGMKPQKTATQIYSSGTNMIKNLIQNRKKPLSALNIKGGKKRSQPNQRLANKHQIMNTQQQNNMMQAQLLAQQALYNNQNQLQMQQDMKQAPSSQYIMHNQKQYQMQIGADGQPLYYPIDDDIKVTDEQVEEDQNLEDEIEQNQNEEDDQDNKGEDYDDQEQYQEIQNNQFDYQQLLQQQKQQPYLFHQLQQQQIAGQQSNILPGAAQMSNIAEDLSTEQIIELLQNNAEAQQNQSDLNGETNVDENGNPIQNQMLPEEVQVQLQQILQERMLQYQQQQQFPSQQQQINISEVQPHHKQEIILQGQAGGNTINDRVQSQQNICNILTESVSKAKERYQHLHPAIESQKRALRIQSSNSSPNRFQGVISASLRDAGAQNQFEQGDLQSENQIVKQKLQFEKLLKQYQIEMQKQENKRMFDAKKAEKIATRDDKIKAMKQKKFEEELVVQQRSQMFKRNAQQVRLCKKVYELASDLEKNKLLEEKKTYKESEQSKQQKKKVIVQTIESYYQDKINMLKERIESERFERQIASEAQKKALRQMKKEMDQEKRNEVQRYIHLLQQEDDKYELQNLNLGRLENEIKKLYNPLSKKGKNTVKN